MKIVIRTGADTRHLWKEMMSRLLSDAEFYLWDEDNFIEDDIDFAIVWAPPSGMLASLKNIKAVFSVGAGISHITDDPLFPKNLPIIRTTGEDLRNRMCEYVLLHTLRIHRRLAEIEKANMNKKWNWIVEPTARSKTVGIMGLGNLGQAAAKSLISIGYKIKGLSRTEKKLDNIDTFVPDEMNEFLDELDILISILPGTPETENIINKKLLNTLPKGAWIINVGRGGHVVDEDLVECIDKGHISGAILDVFRTEPLPKEHSFWHHPNILITCHTASAIEADVGGHIIAKNIIDFIDGKDVPDMVDLEQGY